MPTVVEVRTPARLHLGLMSFGMPTTRAFGGIGLMIDRPGVHLRVSRSLRLESRGPEAERALGFARTCVESWGLREAFAVEVRTAPRGHVGLGSGTQLGLAVAAGIRHLARPQTDGAPSAGPPHPGERPVAPSEHEWTFESGAALDLARAVGRGRRSCVGVHGFARGGLIVEAGRLPDSNPGGGPEDFSPVVARVRLPSEWRCVLIIARGISGLFGDAEKQAFSRLSPVPTEITAELARIALLDLLPAAVEGRFAEFSRAVRSYGLLAGQPFAEESRKLPHAEATAGLIDLLGELGIEGAAQSSWGPAVMACCESVASAGTLLSVLERLGLTAHHEIVIARFDQQGAVLRELE
jgi:beta-ribofuranosylaminobenzene 5'-phosphate synthase